jgi:hypothetical protein
MEHILTKFISAHGDTLSRIQLWPVLLMDSSWHRPSEVIQSMRQLKVLELEELVLPEDL